MVLVVLALALRLLVPGGYMLSAGADGIAVALCPGTTAMPENARPIHAMAGMKHPGGGSTEHGRPEMPCAFAGLAAPALGGADPVLLVVALAFVALLLLISASPGAVRTAPRLRPPLRGPPILR